MTNAARSSVSDLKPEAIKRFRPACQLNHRRKEKENDGRLQQSGWFVMQEQNCHRQFDGRGKQIVVTRVVAGSNPAKTRIAHRDTNDSVAW
jgi:hypothetical protein